MFASLKHTQITSGRDNFTYIFYAAYFHI